ncbi:MAG: alpha/beta hydrolase fold domain-containing protein [Gemmatimonadota bacterium]
MIAWALLTHLLTVLVAFPAGLTGQEAARPPGGDTTSVLLQRRVHSVAPTAHGGMELVVDLYRPLEGALRGAVVLLHGGGFATRHVDIGENKIYGQALAQRGFLAVAAEYRSVRDEPVVDGWGADYARMLRELGDPRLEGAMDQLGPGYPDAVAAAALDLIAAVGWLRDRADELGLDPDRIALFGASSGGISAITTAYAMELYGEENLDVAGVIELRGTLLRPDTTVNPFDADDPPLLMLHGERDRGFPLPEIEAVFRAAREAGTPVQLLSSPEHGHDLGGRALLDLRVDGGRSVVDHIDAFLRAAFAGAPWPEGPERGRLVGSELTPRPRGTPGSPARSRRAGPPG